MRRYDSSKEALMESSEDSEQEQVYTGLPGDKVIRVRRRRGMRIRNITRQEMFGVIREIIFETPFVFMAPILIVLLLLFSAGIYFAEVNAPASNVHSYGEALWDGVILMTTAGAMNEPVTVAGHIIGGIWTVLGCLLFYGTIIASASAYFLLPVSSYFLLPRRGKKAQTIGLIQYKFGNIANLTENQLESLRNDTNAIVDAQLSRIRKGENYGDIEE
jgi:voltage-gated potassium channel